MRITSILENTKRSHSLKAKHGLSLYIETDQMNIIFDLGPDDSYLKNAHTLGIDLNQADAVVISHGHSDHIGGLTYLANVNKHAPIYVSPYALEPHWLKLGGYYHKVGANEQIVSHYGSRLQLISSDRELASGIHLITLSPTTETTRNLYKGKNKQLDDFDHEMMLVIENQEGIVLFSGCSHHGIVQMAKLALERFPNKRITAIIGGFHLIGIPIINTLGKSKEDIISIGNELNAMPIDTIYSCHCTGPKGFTILQSVMQDNLHPMPTGTTIVIDT